ncbi:MAG: transposase [Anaerolineae bacterium]
MPLGERRGGQAEQALGRSRGGFSTKIHAVVDALGNPFDFVLTAGQTHDVTQGQTLLQGRRSEYVIADKGYDANDFLAFIEAMGLFPSFRLARTVLKLVIMTLTFIKNGI